MFRNNKIDQFRRKHYRLHVEFVRCFRLLRSNTLKMFVITAVFGIMSMLIAFGVAHVTYKNSILSSETAVVQTEAAAISGDFTSYASLMDAENAGIYNLLIQYSSLNSIRIRVVNTNYVIASDSYSIENGKTIVNSNVIKVFNNGKSVSEASQTTGTIEAVVPINGNSGEMLGVLVMNMDYSAIESFSEQVSDRTDTYGIILTTVILALALLFANISSSRYKKAFKVVEDVDSGHKDKRIEMKGNTELKDFAFHFNQIMDQNNELDESRQEFVSNVSHELKTPITSIKVLADSLNMQEDVPVELYKEFMQDIAKEIDRENKIIEDLLALVRMDKKASPLNLSSVNLNELLEMVLKRLKPIAQKKNVEMLFESFRPVVAEIDEVKFTQVISNLVENAIKYNVVDGWVHVSLNADYQYFYVRVEDSGIGIPMESQNKVFERFYRVDKARSRETGGTGLGLAIVKNIILMHHGTIKMHSEENIGTTFTLRIPLNYVE